MKRFITVILASLVASGCTAFSTNLSSIEESGAAKNYLKKNSMIFGRLVSLTPGHFISLGATNKGTKHKYIIMPPAANQLFSKHKEDNRAGYFFSILPPGDYKIDKLFYSDGSYSGEINVDMSFSVPRDSAVYLGTVVFSWMGTSNYLVYQSGEAGYSIQDEGEDATMRLWRRFPALQADGLNAVVSLIKIEDPSNH